MKKRSLVSALALGGLLACSMMASAQDTNATKEGKQGKGGKHGPSIDQQMERLTTELTLTDAQKPKVKEVLENTMKQRQELRNVPQEERREKGQAMREEESKKMKAILTPEQFDKWQKSREQMGRKKGPGPGGEKEAPAPKSE